MTDNNKPAFGGMQPFTGMSAVPGDDLETARKKNVPHGPLRSISWNHYSSGMIMGSGVSEKTAMEWQPDGTVLLRVSRTRGTSHSEERIFRVDEDTAAETAALVEKENLAGWGNLRCDPSSEPIIYDYSSDTSVRLEFEETRPVTVGYKAAKQNGGADVLSRLHDLLMRCEKEDFLISSSEHYGTELPFTGMRAGIRMTGEWTCPSCGYDRNSGKFCSECGEARFWVCPECGKDDNTGKYCSECGRKRD